MKIPLADVLAVIEGQRKAWSKVPDDKTGRTPINFEHLANAHALTVQALVMAFEYQHGFTNDREALWRQMLNTLAGEEIVKVNEAAKTAGEDNK